MKIIKTVDAVGHVLCHDLTQIIKDEFKGARFKKGHIVTKDDIPVLLSMGKENLYVFEQCEGVVHENDAALRLAELCISENMTCSDVSEGKIEIFSTTNGLFLVDSNKLNNINSIDEIMIITRKGSTAVNKGDKLCGTRIIPLVIDEKKITEAEKIVSAEPILKVIPFTLKKAAVITTGSEIYNGRIVDKFTPVIAEKLKRFSIEVTEHLTVDDGIDNIIDAIKKMRKADVDIIICTGGMSVDPDDNTPGAIKSCSADIVTYGAPVLPGAMFLLGYFDDGMPIVGLPGCVMYAKATVFDLVLPKLAADVKITKDDFISMGEGGLCLSCDVCTYPNCSFGK
ncbi:MAG: molybdopterin-binding protein [Ruminococcaceae bacterium]|nr:molybdopterin-binding protein [Oscillospiraceae bacterium]